MSHPRPIEAAAAHELAHGRGWAESGDRLRTTVDQDLGAIFNDAFTSGDPAPEAAATPAATRAVPRRAGAGRSAALFASALVAVAGGAAVFGVERLQPSHPVALSVRADQPPGPGRRAAPAPVRSGPSPVSPAPGGLDSAAPVGGLRTAPATSGDPRPMDGRSAASVLADVAGALSSTPSAPMTASTPSAPKTASTPSAPKTASTPSAPKTASTPSRAAEAVSTGERPPRAPEPTLGGASTPLPALASRAAPWAGAAGSVGEAPPEAGSALRVASPPGRALVGDGARGAASFDGDAPGAPQSLQRRLMAQGGGPAWSPRGGRAPCRGEDGCAAYEAMLSADRALRQAYRAAVGAGVSPYLLSGVREQWADVRDRYAVRPSHLIAAYDRLAASLWRAREARLDAAPQSYGYGPQDWRRP